MAIIHNAIPWITWDTKAAMSRKSANPMFCI
jgi:hypothetical protein